MSTLQDDPWGFAAGGESNDPVVDNHTAFEAAARAAGEAAWAARAAAGTKLPDLPGGNDPNANRQTPDGGQNLQPPRSN